MWIKIRQMQREGCYRPVLATDPDGLGERTMSSANSAVGMVKAVPVLIALSEA
jgi:hypothetical protein